MGACGKRNAQWRHESASRVLAQLLLPYVIPWTIILMPGSNHTHDPRSNTGHFKRYAGIPSFLLVILLSLVAMQVNRVIGDFLEANRWVTHTLEVKQEITLTISTLRDTEASQRAYLISGNSERLADYYGRLPSIAEHSSTLRTLVNNNPAQLENVGSLESLIEARRAGMTEVLARFEQGGIEAAREALRTNKSRAEDQQIERLANQMLGLEDELLAKRHAEMLSQATLTRVMTLGAILFCIVLIGIAGVLVFREQRRRLASEVRVRATNAELMNSLEEAHRLGHTLRQLSELGEMLQSCRNIEEATRGLQNLMPQLLPGKAGVLSLINASQNLIEPTACWGGTQINEDALFGPDDCWALRRGHAHPPSGSRSALKCLHLSDDPEPDSRKFHLCVPMAAQGEVLGIISLSADEAITKGDRAIAQAVTEQLSLALANLRLQETLRTQSLNDPLTGLFNRRYLEASLEREVQRAERRNLPLSVLMLDIDHFKRFNDTHGHEAGDALLAQFGALLGRIVRDEDVACRYGGEEFTVLLQEADAQHALTRAGEICAAVRALEVQHRRQMLGPVTVSIGIATLRQHAGSPEELLRLADRALYAAKHAGRDRALLAN